MFPDDGREYFIVTFETISAYKAIELQTRYRNAKNILEKSAVLADMAKYTWSLRYNNTRNYYIIEAGGDQSAGEAFDASIGYLIGSQVSYAAGQAIKSTGNSTTKLYRVMSESEYNSLIKKGQFTQYDKAMESKWFATNAKDAAEWGKKFYSNGNY